MLYCERLLNKTRKSKMKKLTPEALSIMITQLKGIEAYFEDTYESIWKNNNEYPGGKGDFDRAWKAIIELRETLAARKNNS